MRPPASSTLVFRDGRWATASSESLVPGDVVSLTCTAQEAPPQSTALGPARPGAAAVAAAAAAARAAAAAAEGSVCPADVLLLRGSAVVNEAMLTGESAPQTKEDAQGAADSGSSSGAKGGPLDAFLADGDRAHSRHVVFGGTRIIQHFSEDDSAGAD